MDSASPPTPRSEPYGLRVADILIQLFGFLLTAFAVHTGLPVLAGCGALLALLPVAPGAWRFDTQASVTGLVCAFAVCAGLAGVVDPTAKPWQLPTAWTDLLHLTPTSALLFALPYLAWARHARSRDQTLLSAHFAWFAVPQLFNSLLLLSVTPLVEQLGRLAIGAAPSAALASFVARSALLVLFNEALLLGSGWLIDRRIAWRWPSHALVLVASALVAASPLIADLGDHAALASWPDLLHGLAAVPLAAASQCGLWAETFLVTGILLDAIRSKRPTPRAAFTHWRAGLERGALYAALFMAAVLLLAGFSSVGFLVAALQAQPILGAMLLGAVLFPLLKTIVESFDGSSPFLARLRSAYREPTNYVRGVIAGAGVGMAWAADLPAAASGTRFLVGVCIGAMAYAGADLVWNLSEIVRTERMRLQPRRVYALGAALGGFVGGALAWYLDSAQLATVVAKFHAYAVLDYAAAGHPGSPYVVYPLFSKWGAIDLGVVGGGVKLLYAESLSGVINWSLAAPLFGINLVLLKALFEKSWAPLRGLFTPQGLETLVEQTVRVLRWGLWMAPVIYSFLRLAPDPSWYNQDGAIRTLVAIVQSLALPPGEFRSWALSVFLGLLAYDALRVLIWFDHMCLRVATLVNLSFVGGDALDEKAARWVGHAMRTRVIPEGIRRFLTWAPLLIPFYIPRGAEWDQAWGQAETLASSQDPLLPAVATLLIGYRIAALALAGLCGWMLWRWYRDRGRTPTLIAPPAPYVIGNGQYVVELAPDGRGYSRCESEERPGFIVDLTRRPDDPMSLRGKFVYLREVDAEGHPVGPEWSLAPEPLRYGVSAVSQLSPTRLRVVHAQAGIRIDTRIEVAANEPVETWDLDVHNSADQARVIELTTYQEFAVGPVDAYRRTPAFAGLHVGTVFVKSLGAILARNRLMRTSARDPAQPRISREVGFHAFGGEAELIGYQDARPDFLGLGSPRAPEPRMETLDAEGLRHGFDPCASLRLRIELPANGSRRLRFVDGYARDELVAAERIAKFLGKSAPNAERMRKLFETPRERVTQDDDGLRAWSAPWAANGLSLRAPTDARRPWTHVIANPRGQGAVVSSEGAVWGFAGNAQQNALSPSCLENLPAQQPGEIFLVLDLDSGECFSPGLIPLRRPDAERECSFGLGQARYASRAQDLEVALEVFVNIDEPAQYRVLRVRNLGSTPRRLRVLSHVEIVLAEVGQDSCGRVQVDRTATSEGADVLLFRNPRNDFVRGWAFVASSLEHPEIETLRSRVFGQARDLARPQLLLQGQPDAACADDGWRCAAFCAEFELAPGAVHESLTVLGQTATREDAVALALRLRHPDAMQAARQRVVLFWEEKLGILRVKTTDSGFDRLVNDWLPYQVFVSRLWGRTGPAQRSGAYGFRDQLQDVLPLLWIDPLAARQQILLHAAQQFREGDVLKWWHPAWDGRTGNGVRTRASDPHLWLPYVVLRYLAATGDKAILDEQLPFLEGPAVPEGQEGCMLAPRTALDRANLYEHCRRAVELSLEQQGAHGLPLLGSGDWNDGLDAPGLQMRGESTWMAFFLHDVLRDFAPLAELRENLGAGERYRNEAARIAATVIAMWRGSGWVRASSDEGEELIYADALTASWAVLSDSVKLKRGIEALERGCEQLERDTRVLLLSPAFDEHSRPYPGRIAEYPPGVRENGGQYSHGASWLIDAWLHCADLAEQKRDTELAARCRQRARELWRKISPLSKCTAEELPRYGLPPHQQPADVFEGPGYEGRGGWPWYTGAAARMLSAAYALLGLRMENGRPSIGAACSEAEPVEAAFHGHVLRPRPAPPGLPPDDSPPA